MSKSPPARRRRPVPARLATVAEGIVEIGRTSFREATGSSRLRDRTKRWVTNAYRNMIVELLDRDRAGEYRTITANDADSLTLDAAWLSDVPVGTTFGIKAPQVLAADGAVGANILRWGGTLVTGDDLFLPATAESLALSAPAGPHQIVLDTLGRTTLEAWGQLTIAGGNPDVNVTFNLDVSLDNAAFVNAWQTFTTVGASPKQAFLGQGFINSWRFVRLRVAAVGAAGDLIDLRLTASR